MTFEVRQKVLFRHCDPAGIVFFPRYFEMMNDCVEAFFADALSWPFQELLADGGIPTAGIRTDFVAPSLHGDDLLLRLTIRKVGRSSTTYEMTATCADEVRFRTEATLVHVDLDGRPARWPDRIARTLTELKKGTP